jgi:hypothetical protein
VQRNFTNGYRLGFGCCIINFSILRPLINHQQDWPVGAMVARGPPKAKVVGSSPISVVHDFFFAG